SARCASAILPLFSRSVADTAVAEAPFAPYGRSPQLPAGRRILTRFSSAVTALQANDPALARHYRFHALACPPTPLACSPQIFGVSQRHPDDFSERSSSPQYRFGGRKVPVRIASDPHTLPACRPGRRAARPGCDTYAAIAASNAHLRSPPPVI